MLIFFVNARMKHVSTNPVLSHVIIPGMPHGGYWGYGGLLVLLSQSPFRTAVPCWGQIT